MNGLRTSLTGLFVPLQAVAAAAGAAPLAAPAGPTLDWALQVWTLITFGLVLFVLWRYAYGPLRAMLGRRDAELRDTLAQAEAARRAAEELHAQNVAQLDRARTEARELIEESRRIAREVQHEAEQQARVKADQVLAQTQAELDAEVQRRVEELKETVANLSLGIARQIVKENLDERRHAELIDEFVARLKQTP